MRASSCSVKVRVNPGSAFVSASCEGFEFVKRYSFEALDVPTSPAATVEFVEHVDDLVNALLLAVGGELKSIFEPLWSLGTAPEGIWLQERGGHWF